jgi:exosortase A-associated hydrolase 1
MQPTEQALVIDCDGRKLVGIAHLPQSAASRGVVIVVGGPQYRVGSHRQFVLLARALAAGGTPVLRFDYRGMGDADGPPVEFRSTAPDIRAAVDKLQTVAPAVREVVLWGLCDAASAILMYVREDARISGVVLANPWVRSEAGIARAYLQHYYLGRLLSADWWRGLFAGHVRIGSSLADLGRKMLAALGTRAPTESGDANPRDSLPFQQAMLGGIQAYSGQVLLIISGKDLTAAEFVDLAQGSRQWRRALLRRGVSRSDLAQADHTFSRREWRDDVARITTQWLRTW